MNKQVHEIPLNLLHPNPQYPNKYFDSYKLYELAANIKTNGLKEPIRVVRQNGKYLIVMGERAWRASQLAEKVTIPAIVEDYTADEIDELSLRDTCDLKIPFHKPYTTDDEIAEVIDSIKSGWLTMGPKTMRFEEQFKEYVGASHAVSMNSCTACLHLALKALGLKAGDEVIVPAITFTATAEVVTYFNARPVIADVDDATITIDVEDIERKITPRTKAIIPVHFAGQPCDMTEIMDVARRHGCFVVEDAAHSLPALYKNQKIGKGGDIVCFSFYATKTLSTGEGGMATTENAEWADNLRINRLHGISRDGWKRYSSEGSWHYEVLDAGFKYNMTDIHAALGIAQLRKIDWMWARRKSIAKKYDEFFRAYDEVTTPTVKTDRESAWHLYVLRLNLDRLRIDRNRFIQELKERGIGTSVHFIPLYRHPFYQRTFGYHIKDFPVSEKIYDSILSLPLYPAMSDDDVDTVTSSVAAVLNKYRS